MKKPVKCRKCGGVTLPIERVTRSLFGQLFGSAFFLIGGALLIWFPFGTLAGAVLLALAVKLGYSKQKTRKCLDCGYHFR
jgi:hypothetical protein